MNSILFWSCSLVLALVIRHAIQMNCVFISAFFSLLTFIAMLLYQISFYGLMFSSKLSRFEVFIIHSVYCLAIDLLTIEDSFLINWIMREVDSFWSMCQHRHHRNWNLHFSWLLIHPIIALNCEELHYLVLINFVIFSNLTYNF